MLNKQPIHVFAPDIIEAKDPSGGYFAGEWVLVFTNREVHYRWEVHEGSCSGYACMFTEDFLPLHTHLRPADWAVGFK